MRVILVYGSVTTKTEMVAKLIEEQLGDHLEKSVEVSEIEPADLKEYDLVIAGIPTWDVGELEYSWQDFYDNMDGQDYSGLHIAIFGLGDQDAYADTYQDAMGILYDKFIECGAGGQIGFTSVDGHDHDESKAQQGDQFCGLAIDEDNQSNLTEERVNDWCEELIQWIQSKTEASV
ncbi:MAG TPA: flavodoxin [Phycisphaerales bacterium]|nr:flavodoxin [Phycisphaerales bacterium]